MTDLNCAAVCCIVWLTRIVPLQQAGPEAGEVPSSQHVHGFDELLRALWPGVPIKWAAAGPVRR